MTYGKKGFVVRLVYLSIAILHYAIMKLQHLKKRGVVVLCYHGVLNGQKQKFIRQISMARKGAISTKDINFFNSKKTIQPAVCFTFDDAFTNLLVNVIPITNEMRLPVTIFVPTGSLGTLPAWLKDASHTDKYEEVMSVEEISALKKNPFVNFGSHTIDHYRLTELSSSEIREQLRKSRNAISAIIGRNITELAVPHGACNSTVVQIAVDEGYERIYTLQPDIYYNDSNTSSHLIGRFSVSPDDWLIEFYLTINGAYSWLSSWRLFLRKIRNDFFNGQ
jgi:peptidoglycan/xylan/chitin deacetylase (PgdA/CDA1 family)